MKYCMVRILLLSSMGTSVGAQTNPGPAAPSTPNPPDPATPPSGPPAPTAPPPVPGTDAIFRMDYRAVGHVRTDPILETNCLSAHVHTFYGPPLLYPAVTYDELVASDPTRSSGNVQENLSLYWHPTVYRVEADGTRNIVEQEMTTAYYRYRVGQTRAFPNDFRMIGGFDPAVSLATCVGPSACQRGAACTSPNPFFPTTACEELEVSMTMPMCWTGGSIKDDNQNHVAYADGGLELDDPCPDSHPVRLPTIELFFRFFNYPGGHHEFSDGTGIFHADYVSGWNETFLQEVLDLCALEETTVCSQRPFTFRNGVRYDGGDNFQDTLKANEVPLARTSCITDEIIDNTKVVPSVECTGNLINAFGCPGP